MCNRCPVAVRMKKFDDLPFDIRRFVDGDKSPAPPCICEIARVLRYSGEWEVLSMLEVHAEEARTRSQELNNKQGRKVV